MVVKWQAHGVYFSRELPELKCPQSCYFVRSVIERGQHLMMGGNYPYEFQISPVNKQEYCRWNKLMDSDQFSWQKVKRWITVSDYLTYTLRYINYLMLHQLGQRPSDVLLQSVESHGRLVRQHIHALRKLVSYCEREVFGLQHPETRSWPDRHGSTFEWNYSLISIVSLAPSVS